MPATIVAVAIAIAMVAGTAAAAQAPAVTRATDGRVSVRADGLPLGQLLRELAALTPMDLRIDPAVEDVSVSMDLVDVPVEHAIYLVLERSGVNSVVAGLYRTTDESQIRVVAGVPRDAVAVASTRGREAADERASKDDEAVALPTPPLPSDDTLAADKEQEKLAAAAAAAEAAPPAPGAMTSAAWMQAMFPTGGVRTTRSGPTMLPFVDGAGQAIVEFVPPGPRHEAMLPFVDEAGLPIVLPIQPRPDGMVMLPFADAAGRPVLSPAAPTAPSIGSPTPGRPGSGPRR
jgi:hypothetical protein